VNGYRKEATMKKTPMMSTHFTRAYVARLTRSLSQIVEEHCGRPLRMDASLRTVCAGLTLYGKASYRADTYMGYPWSTSAALHVLAGLGYIFEPRMALAVIQRLEARHIVDRRWVELRPERRKAVRYTWASRGSCRQADRHAS
jgi:hypothetical protein